VRQLDVHINIDPTKWLAYYRQPQVRVQARSTDGRIIELPASKLRPFVGHSGVNGRFRLTLDNDNKLLSIERVPTP